LGVRSWPAQDLERDARCESAYMSSETETEERFDSLQLERWLSPSSSELDDLLSRAGQVRDDGLRRAGRPGMITFSKKVFIPLTTLCRDRCHYCTFVDTPAQLRRKGEPIYMTPEHVIAVARRGATEGCKEALFTLGDRPETRWPEARDWLVQNGYESTLHYVGEMARLVRDETGLLPHFNPGVMSKSEMAALRPFAASMGMMLETTSRLLFETPGQVHFGSPDKDPDVRVRVLREAGELQIPFTTGLLVGIGETIRDRAESLLAIRRVQHLHGHIQEVIIQNFRAKPRTAASSRPDASFREYLATVATARLVLGPSMRIQVPPNLSDPSELEQLLRAGADDWGGVSPLTADHVNPERPWPELDSLTEATADLGFSLRERLTVHPEFQAEMWVHPAMRAALEAVVDPTSGLASDAIRPETTPRQAVRSPRALIERAASDPDELDDEEWGKLLTATAEDLDELVATADSVRRYIVGEAVSLVANRNVSVSAFGAPLGPTYTLIDLAEIVRDAHRLGATEICLRGSLPAEVDAEAYLQLARVVKAARPDIHLHAFAPPDIVNFALRSGRSLDDAVVALHEAGVDTVPGTGVRILSDRVRALAAPGDLPVDVWLKVMNRVHTEGMKTSSVIHYGGPETPLERVEHLRALLEMQRRSGAITELVPMPVSDGAPLVAGRLPLDEHRAMFAVARLMIGSSIRNIQVPWTRFDAHSVQMLLQAGANDLGGTLFDGRILPEVGGEFGREMPPETARRVLAPLFRPLRQRATDYTDIAPDRRIV